MFISAVDINRESFPDRSVYPFSIRSLQETARVELTAPVTFFTGANGSGKSALLDAIARRAGLLPWGGTKVHRAHHNPYETRLASYISFSLQRKAHYGFHFRAEAFFNFAASLDDILLDDPGRDKYFGGGSLNTLSHGESFLAFFRGYSFQLDGLYLLDEPEAALSPENQLEFARLLREGAAAGNRQYIIATHSPILLACPESCILSFNSSPIKPVSYRETGPYRFYQDFLRDPGGYFQLIPRE